MKFAYADPPYLGCAKFYEGMHPEWEKWNSVEAHQELIDRLCANYSDGWAMSLHTPALRTILPLCPPDCRVLAWVKPFASFKPGVGLAYAWEPVIFRGGRKRLKTDQTTRDWCAVNITVQKGLTGAKPPGFVHWILDCLHAQPGDAVDDLFPGTGGCGDVIRARIEGMAPAYGLFATVAA